MTLTQFLTSISLVYVTEQSTASGANASRDDAASPGDRSGLPNAPAGLNGVVKAWEEDVEFPTFEPGVPDPNPMFLEKRVYQGSSGRVYPLPFIDRVATEPVTRRWKALHIENEFLRLMVLPEIGGRIHAGFDKRNDYDFFYRQHVIKPALVGLAGPWISGGVEFNWPQHHRPATFMPVSTEIEQHEDGSVTLWCSDHDPILRMKGMHGICLHPGSAAVEVKVRLFNRTPFTQTFLWWANVAARVHQQYQSFFPTDVRFVADHAKRAMTTFPLSNGSYYGVPYAERERNGVPADQRPSKFVPDGSYPANDLSWYANIPVPTSYMVTHTDGDFFGGYDHRAKAGVVHVASHHVAPGKKQWTWGNHEFGYAWDRSLSEDGAPYIELMAGAYTDNQPDFSYLAPWETKTFSHHWHPIGEIGIPQAANRDCALSLVEADGVAQLGLCVTKAVPEATITLLQGEREVARWTQKLSPAAPTLLTAKIEASGNLHALVHAQGGLLIDYNSDLERQAQTPIVAQEPKPPEDIESVEDLYLTGVHLEQYRHATRLPELYWQEALRRDPGESRTHNRLGLWRLRRGEFALAAEHFVSAIERITRLNPNPYDGEAYYNLGLTRRFQQRYDEAYDSFYKSTWNAAWRAPAYFALAELDARARRWQIAIDHLRRSLAADADNLNARNLLALALKESDDAQASRAVREDTLALDPMDIWSRWLRGTSPRDGQESLDLAFDLLACGQDAEAIRVLQLAGENTTDGSAPMILLTLASVERRLDLPAAEETYRRACSVSPRYCFPSRLEEMVVLEQTTAKHPQDGMAYALLGNFLYDRRRHQEAIEAWESAVARGAETATVWRNLGIAHFNHGAGAAAAIAAFDHAFTLSPQDARILYERDQLWKRVGESPECRLRELLDHRDLVALRDDLSVELATLLNQTGRPEQALELLLGHAFQPWEGGEGLVLGQYERARTLLGRRAFAAGHGDEAVRQFEASLHPPHNLAEAKHLLANRGEIFYWLGMAEELRGDVDHARACWQRAAAYTGDFQQMAVRSVSDNTYWSALALQKLGKTDTAVALLQRIYDYSHELEAAEPKIDYFATSLPSMLLFDEDLRERNRTEACFLRSQALAGMGRNLEATQMLRSLLSRNENHAGAADLLQQMDATADCVRAS